MGQEEDRYFLFAQIENNRFLASTAFINKSNQCIKHFLPKFGRSSIYNRTDESYKYLDAFLRQNQLHIQQQSKESNEVKSE